MKIKTPHKIVMYSLVLLAISLNLGIVLPTIVSTNKLSLSAIISIVFCIIGTIFAIITYVIDISIKSGESNFNLDYILMSEKDVVVIFCPPLSKYPVQPTDQSKCEIIECPDCNKSMWLSEKKKAVMTMSKAMGKEIIMNCYLCMENKVKSRPEIFLNHTRVDL
jgi:hypothetical protein